MGNQYTFTTGGNIQSGSIVRAEDFTTEYTALQSAFDGSSGHTHDGTTGEGGRIEVVGPAGQLVVTASALTGSSSKLLNLGTSSNLLLDVFIADDKKIQFGDAQDATIEYDEDGTDTLAFAGANIRINNTNKIIEFRDADLKIHSSADGQLDIDADTELEIVAPTVDIQASTAITLASDAVTFGEGADSDITISFNTVADDGELKWVHDADHFKFMDDVVVDSTKKIYFNDEGGEHISGDATDLTITSGNDLNLTATTDINIPANVGLTFGNDAEKIEGDGTDLTISGNNINLTAVADVNIPADVGLTFATAEKIESDGTDLTITVGSGGDVNLSADNVKLTTDGAILGFGADNEVTLTHVHNTGLILGGTTPRLTIGDAGAEDAKIVFDGNAQDFYIGLDDSEDDLVIGKGSALGTTPAISIDENVLVTVADNLTLKSDSAVLGFGADTDTTLTHTDGTGLTLNSTNKLTFGDAATFIHQSSDGVMTIDGEATIDLNASTAVLVSNDLKLDSDAAVLGFGVHNDITITHVADTGLTVTSVNTDANAGPVLVLDRNNDNASNNDIIGSVQFKGDNASNASVIMGEIKTKITDTTAGNEDSDVIISNMVAGSATPQLTLSATGVTANVGFTNTGDLTVGDDLLLNSDSAVISLGAGADATITHDGTTGVTIAANPITIDSGGDIVLDADDADIIFKDGGTTIAKFTNSSSDFVITTDVDDKDFIIKGQDATSEITALTLDMSEAGKAIFNQDINVPGEVQTTKVAFTDGDDAMTVADGGSVTFADDVTVTGRAVPGTVPSAGSATSGTVTFDLSSNNNFHLTTSGNVDTNGLTFSNHNVAGQTGTIKVVNSGHSIAVNDMVAINAGSLTALQAAGTYMLTYLVTATGGGNDTIFVSATGALS